MSAQEQTVRCPDCGHGVLRPSQERCTECGLQWDGWLDQSVSRVMLRGRDWLLLLVVLPCVAAIPPLMTGRGAITGARSFEASYLLTIPGFVGIIYLSWRYALPLAWRFGRQSRIRRDGIVRRPGIVGCIAAFFLLLLLQVILFLVVIRLGFVYFVEPLRTIPPPRTVDDVPLFNEDS